MGLILVPLKSAVKLQLPSTVEGLVPIWHHFQYQKTPCWNCKEFTEKLLFHQKMKLIGTEVLPRNVLVLTRHLSRNCFSDDVSQLRNIEMTESAGVWEFTWVPGLLAQSPCIEEQPWETQNNTAPFLVESHQLSGYAESPSLLFLLNGKCLWLWVQVLTCTTEEAGADRRSVSSLTLGSSLDRRPR